MIPDLSVKLGRLHLRNPIVCASGPLGHGREVHQSYDLRAFGAFVTKSITLEPREGNPRPHLVRTEGGWLNSVGLRNPGLAAFLTKDLPFLRTLEVPIVASLAGHSAQEYCTLAEWLSEAEGVMALELNVSCPNVEDGLVFGTDPGRLYRLVAAVRKVTPLPLWVKLTPNVTDVVSVARAAVEGGAEALTVANTLLGMAVDVHTRRPKLGGLTGGLSGPAVRPVILRMVWEVRKAVSVPIIGVGGVTTWEHAVEYLLVGASAVGMASALIEDPQAHKRVLDGLRTYLVTNRIPSVRALVGALEVPSGGADVSAFQVLALGATEAP